MRHHGQALVRWPSSKITLRPLAPPRAHRGSGCKALRQNFHRWKFGAPGHPSPPVTADNRDSRQSPWQEPAPHWPGSGCGGRLRLRGQRPAGDKAGPCPRLDRAVRPSPPVPSLRGSPGRRTRSLVVPLPPEKPTGARRLSDAVEFDCDAPSQSTRGILPGSTGTDLLQSSGGRDAAACVHRRDDGIGWRQRPLALCTGCLV